MSFKQLTLNIHSAEAEQLSEIFFELGALSVSIEDQYEGTELEQPIFNEPGMDVNQLWENSKLVVLLDEDCSVVTLIASAEELFGKPLRYDTEIVDDQDWVRLTQSQFEPIRVSECLYIVPSWHTLPDPNATGIILDPGLAFGTGSHPTTFMCLKWLSANVQNSHEILDYGCGSGILAISAKKLGAAHVDGVDIDPQAIESSLANALTNQVSLSFMLPYQMVSREYDVVVANILSNPLRMLASALASYVKPKGQIILSGILASQIDEMSAIYNQWFEIEVAEIHDGWVLLAGIKRSNA